MTEAGMAAGLRKRRFTVDEYHRMGEVGILSDDDRVELVEGEIVEMTPIGSRHAAQVDRLASLLWARLGSRAIVRVQGPVQLSTDSQVQPDVVLLRPRDDFYAKSHPGPNDVLLIIEVADTSLDTDRRVKVPLYAKSGIPEAWVLDLTANQVIVHRHPTPQGYGEARALVPGQSLAPHALSDLSLTLTDLLG